MKTSHTPAPWLITGNTVYALMHDGWRKGAEQFKNRFSASITIDRDVDESEEKAIVTLIAAAPELLEACKPMIPQGVCLTNKNIPDETVICLDCTVGELRKLSAAIAKATGDKND